MESTSGQEQITLLDFAGFAGMTEIERIQLTKDATFIGAFGCTINIALLDCQRPVGSSEESVLVLELNVRDRGQIYWEYDPRKGYESLQGRGFSLREIAEEMCREFDQDILEMSRRLGCKIPWTRCRIEIVHALRKAGWIYETPH